MKALAHPNLMTAMCLVLAGAAGIAAGVPAIVLLKGGRGGGSVVSPLLVRDSELGVAWTGAVTSAAALQRESMAQLLGIVVVVALGAVVSAGITLVGLSFIRAASRRGDLMIRRAVGASRRSLGARAFGEGLAITVAAMAGGIAAGLALTHGLVGAWPDRLETWTAGWALVTLPLAALALISVPLTLWFARGARLGEADTWGTAFVPPILQLQMGAGLGILMAASMAAHQATNLVTAPGAGRDAVRVELDAAGLTPGVRSAEWAALLRRVASMPGVSQASLSDPAAVAGLGMVDWLETDCGQCPTGNIILRWHSVEARHNAVSPDTFSVLDLPIIEGRTFGPTDEVNAARVVVVNRHLALRHFENGRAVGRTLYLGSYLRRVGYAVVGVVDDDRPPVLGSGSAPRPAVYLSILQHPAPVADLLVQVAAGSEDSMAAAIGAALPAHVRAAPAPSLALVRSRQAAVLAWFAEVVRIEGALAFLIASIGVVIGVHAWGQAMVPELAIRRAVGAGRWRIIRLVLLRTTGLVLGGYLVARFALAPSFAYLLGQALRDPSAMQALPEWNAAIVLGLAALVGVAGPLLGAVRVPPARWLP
jgi:hypothetical protein